MFGTMSDDHTSYQKKKSYFFIPKLPPSISFEYTFYANGINLKVIGALLPVNGNGKKLYLYLRFLTRKIMSKKEIKTIGSLNFVL